MPANDEMRLLQTPQGEVVLQIYSASNGQWQKVESWPSVAAARSDPRYARATASAPVVSGGSTRGRVTGGESAGESAGPSQGPDIGTTFPGYYLVNPNVEQQYADWRESLRAQYGADTDKHLDMNAFRAHLLALGAPDPGASPVGTPGSTPSAPVTPTTPLPTIPGLTPTPTFGPGKDYKPSAPFAPDVKTGTAADLIGGGLDLSKLSPLDIPYYMPFSGAGDKDSDKQASRNLMRALGFNMDVDNPYSSYVAGKVPGMSQIAAAQAILGGKSIGTLPQDLPGLTYQGLAGGGMSPGLGLLNQIGGLQKNLATPDKLSADQAALANLYKDQGNAFDLYQNLSNLPSALRQAQSKLVTTFADRFSNTAGAFPGRTFLQFLGGGGF